MYVCISKSFIYFNNSTKHSLQNVPNKPVTEHATETRVTSAEEIG